MGQILYKIPEWGEGRVGHPFGKKIHRASLYSDYKMTMMMIIIIIITKGSLVDSLPMQLVARQGMWLGRWWEDFMMLMMVLLKMSLIHKWVASFFKQICFQM